MEYPQDVSEGLGATMHESNAEPSEDALFALLIATAQFMRSIESVRSRIATAEQLGNTHVRALARIAEHGPQTPKALAASLQLSTGAVTPLIDKLVDMGMIERSTHATDRRSFMLSLTDRGRVSMVAVREHYEAAIGFATRGGSEASVAQLTEYLAKVSSSLAA
jgi:DNA-binding MarR family transcriptional regulator